MLALAEAKPRTHGGASIEYLEGPADRLPARDDEFDVVTCQQGLQFFPDRPSAVAEMRRALRPGGRIGVAVWTDIEHSPPFCALANAIAEVAGAELANRYRRGPWGFPDGEQLGTLLKEAGFVDVRVSSHVLPVTFENGPAQFAATLAASPLAGELDQLSDEQKQHLIDSLARRIGDGPIEAELESNIALARR
jgi:ubiquinone/menaquinone biosynthesis C-methylase UbiE